MGNGKMNPGAVNPELTQRQLANYQQMLAMALAKNAEVTPLECPLCGGTQFVMHEVVEAVKVKLPRVLSGRQQPHAEGEYDEIAHAVVQRVFMCPNPKCDKKIVGVMDYGSELPAIKRRLAELKGEKPENKIVIPGEEVKGEGQEIADDSSESRRDADKADAGSGEKE